MECSISGLNIMVGDPKSAGGVADYDRKAGPPLREVISLPVLKIAIRIFRHADFAGMAGPMSPPLPLLFGYWLPGLGPGPEPKMPGWDAAVPELIARARLLASVSFGVPLVLLVYGWIARRRGLLAGALAGVLVALSPTVLAAAALATTDACFALFGVLALLAIAAYQARPTTRSFLAMGGAIGLALASKQSAVILFAVAAVELWLHRPRPVAASSPVVRTLRAGRWLASRGAGLVAVAFLADWALCGFAVARFGAKGTSCVPPESLTRLLGVRPSNDPGWPSPLLPTLEVFE